MAARGWRVVLLPILLLSMIDALTAQTITGCPAYGCRPTGTFSFDIDLPTNVSYAWRQVYSQRALVRSLGCIGNDVSVVCQSNRSNTNGYVSLDPLKGNVNWRDEILNFPAGLPIMDVYGDIIGSDGHKLTKIDNNGKVQDPVISLNNDIYPVYSLDFSDNNVVLIVSKNGLVIAYETDGIPLASIQLRGIVERSNGTFIPVTTPVISGSRAYILTEFRPDYYDDASPDILGMRRLYAIDIYQRMTDRLDIAWTFNFEREHISPEECEGCQDNNRETYQGLKHLLMVNSDTNVVYVFIPPPENNILYTTSFLWALKDNTGSDDPSILFKIPMLASAMAIYENNSFKSKSEIVSKNRSAPWQSHNFSIVPSKSKQEKVTNAVTSPLWVLTSTRSQIVHISPLNGTILTTYNISTILGHNASVTSQLMSTRNSNGTESLIFGAKLQSTAISHYYKSPNATSFVVSLSLGKINWAIAVPEDKEVKGQLVSSPNTINEEERDVLIALGSDDESSIIFAIH